jgi:hypothetical protein
MFKNNNLQEQTNLVLVPAQLVDEIKQLLNELKLNQSTQKEVNNSLGEFISEKEARKLLDRKATWFYEQRRSGRLPYSKVGSKVYYKRQNLFNLLKNN